jgi:hypothetical protein
MCRSYLKINGRGRGSMLQLDEHLLFLREAPLF